MISDEVSKAKFLAIFTEMRDTEMSIEVCAEKFAKVVDEIILTAEVSAGIPVSTTGTAEAQTGATTAKGVIV